MACIVFLCVTVNHSTGAPAVYSIDRLFETLVGVALACGIDVLLPYQSAPQPDAPAQSAQPPEGQAPVPSQDLEEQTPVPAQDPEDLEEPEK